MAASARSSRSRPGRVHASQSRIARCTSGWLSSPKWSVRPTCSTSAPGNSVAPAAVAAVRRARPDQQVAHHVADRVPLRRRSGWRRPGGSARAAAAARPRPARPPGRARPGSASRGSGRTPRSRAAGPGRATPWPMPQAIGAPRCGVPSVITSLTLSRHGSSTSCGHRAGRPDHQPAERVPDQRDPGDRRPASRRPRRWTSAVSAAPFSRSGSPVLTRSMSGVQPRPASISAYVVPGALAVPLEVGLVLAEPVQEQDEPPGRLGVRRGQGVRLEVDVGAAQPHRHRDRQLGPLAQQPVADQPVDRRAHEPAAGLVLEARPGAGRPRPCRARSTAARRPEPEPAVDRAGDAPVQHAAGPGDALDPVEDREVGVPHGPDEQVVGDLGQQGQRRRARWDRGAVWRHARQRRRSVHGRAPGWAPCRSRSADASPDVSPRRTRPPRRRPRRSTGRVLDVARSCRRAAGP